MDRLSLYFTHNKTLRADLPHTTQTGLEIIKALQSAKPHLGVDEYLAYYASASRFEIEEPQVYGEVAKRYRQLSKDTCESPESVQTWFVCRMIINETNRNVIPLRKLVSKAYKYCRRLETLIAERQAAAEPSGA